MDFHETTPLLPRKIEDSDSSFTYAITTSQGERRPQAIAHRGYKYAFPENTMGAFRGAVKAGSNAIETDIHLSKDGVVVLSHDPDLKRCFGQKEKIIDCDWAYLETLKTLQAPHESMPRLIDLLSYLAEPGLEDIWVLLDIKFDNDSDDVMRLIASTIVEVKPSRPWNERILLGCWATKYLPLCETYLPGFPIVHIGASLQYAREFLKVPGVNFNMLQQSMVGPCGKAFLKDVRAANRSIFLWTVNDERVMRWCISKGVDGVITDDPKKYLEILKNYTGEKVRITVQMLASAVWFKLLVTLFGPLFRRRFDNKSERERLHRGARKPSATD